MTQHDIEIQNEINVISLQLAQARTESQYNAVFIALTALLERNPELAQIHDLFVRLINQYPPLKTSVVEFLSLHGIQLVEDNQNQSNNDTPQDSLGSEVSNSELPPDIDPIKWLESLAKRSPDVDTRGFTTSADMEIAEIDPDSVTIDEPGYIPYGQSPPKPEPSPKDEIPDWLTEQMSDNDVVVDEDQTVLPKESIPDWLQAIEPASEEDAGLPDWLRAGVESTDDWLMDMMTPSPAPVAQAQVPPPPHIANLPNHIQLMKRYIAEQPEDTKARLAYAQELARMGLFPASIEVYRGLLKQRQYIDIVYSNIAAIVDQVPNNKPFMILLGDTYRELGKLDQAMQCYMLASKLVETSSGENIEITHINSVIDNMQIVKDPVQFTAFAPQIVQPSQKYSLIAYAFLPDVYQEIRQDVEKFRDELGSDDPKERKLRDTVMLERGVDITILPECEDILITPNQISKPWDIPWVRFNFDFKVPEDYKYQELSFRISIQIKGMEIGQIRLSCDIDFESSTKFEEISLPENPLEQARANRLIGKAIAQMYRQIFISYSRKDKEIALKRAHEIESILSDKVFIDVKDIQQGNDWQYALAKAIDDSDVFHLLWSENSANSEYCQYEWQYALKHKQPEVRSVGVIRPIYWQDPMPAPPPELAHLHFQKVELE